MARSTSEKVGRGPCPDCGEAVMFRKSSGGMLCHKCENCDSSGYASPGGDAYAKRMKSIASTYPKETGEALPLETPATNNWTPPPVTTPRKNSVFSLGAL